MRLPGDLGQLTYCLNIHPTQTMAEVMAALTGPVAAVRRSPGSPQLEKSGFGLFG